MSFEKKPRVAEEAFAVVVATADVDSHWYLRPMTTMLLLAATSSSVGQQQQQLVVGGSEALFLPWLMELGKKPQQ